MKPITVHISIHEDKPNGMMTPCVHGGGVPCPDCMNTGWWYCLPYAEDEVRPLLLIDPSTHVAVEREDLSLLFAAVDVAVASPTIGDYLRKQLNNLYRTLLRELEEAKDGR